MRSVQLALCCILVLVVAVLGFKQVEVLRLRGQLANEARQSSGWTGYVAGNTAEKGDVLRCLIDRSDMVVLGSVSTNHGTVVHMQGAGYGTIEMLFSIEQVLKGHPSQASTIEVGIGFQGCVPMPPGRGQRYVLFLDEDPVSQRWAGADPWFSMQSDNVSLIDAVRKFMASQNRDSPNRGGRATPGI